MQFQVPQFIETEDKIVGPFTLKQFFYIAGAGAFAFLFFLIKLPAFIIFVLSAFVVGLALGLAFLKVNGRPLPAVIGSALQYFWQPHTYVWQSDTAPSKHEEIARSRGLESIISGLLLKNTWNALQTKAKEKSKAVMEERYQIFEKLSGERKIARRVDYR